MDASGPQQVGLYVILVTLVCTHIRTHITRAQHRYAHLEIPWGAKVVMVMVVVVCMRVLLYYYYYYYYNYY